MEIQDDASVVEAVFKQMKARYLKHTTKDVAFRKQQLHNLIKGHKQLRAKFDEALKQDLAYTPFTADLLSHSSTHNEMEHILQNVDHWNQTQKIETPLTMGLAFTEVQPEPLGLVLVLAAWNYPVYTALPFVAVAMAAGNSVILKPSEFAPHTSRILKELFDKYLDKDYYKVIEGKVQVAIKLTSLSFDSILFTGSTVTGRAVAMSAAKNLVPCVLELGGKCPVIVDETADLESAATRILWGKFTNCGQTCIGADHIIVHKSIKTKFVDHLLRRVDQMYGKDKPNNQDMGRIVTKMHVKRLEGYLRQNHGGTILYGGKVYEDSLFMDPTIVDSPNLESTMMKQQIFGPILPIQQYSNLDELIDYVNARPKPLVVYCFSENSKTTQKIRTETSSGAFVVNDLLIHMTNTCLPFGGVGMSGYGRYHGKSGFDACSNLKSIMYTKPGNYYPMDSRFPPYTQSKKKMLIGLLGIGKMTYQQIFRASLFGLSLGYFSYNTTLLQSWYSAATAHDNYKRV